MDTYTSPDGSFTLDEGESVGCVALSDALRKAAEGTLPDTSTTWGRGREIVRLMVPVKGGEAPQKPRRKPDTSTMDRDLAVLRIASESVLSISTDDHFAEDLSS